MKENVKLEKIYVVFKTHFDIGFTGFVSDVVGRYSSDMLKEVNEICDRTRHNAEHEKYVWTMSSWPLLQSIQGSEPEDREKALAFVRSRQLIWHMLPFTTHTEFCGLEEWVRGMYISRGLTERYGYRPKDAKMTDVPGHTWSVPSLLKKAGVQMLHLGCNGFSTPPDVPPVFFWEGPDGERLLTFYSKGAYGTGVLPPDDWTHPVWLAMIQTNDNHGPHQASIVDEMKASIAAKGLHGTKLHIGSLTDFAEDFLSRRPDLPVIRGDLADAWIHGVGTAPREVSRVRELRGRVSSAESMLALRMLAGEIEENDATQAKRLLDDSYEHTLLFGEHTWGMDCKTFLFPRGSYEKQAFLQNKQSERYRRMEHSWQEQIDYVNRAERSLAAALARLGAGGTGGTAGVVGNIVGTQAAVDTLNVRGPRSIKGTGYAVDVESAGGTGHEDSAGNTGEIGHICDNGSVRGIRDVGGSESMGGDTEHVSNTRHAAGTGSTRMAGNIGKAFRVYNSLGWSRDADVALSAERLPQEGEALIDCATGEMLPITVRDGAAWIKVKGLPALGYKTVAYAEAPASAREQTLQREETEAVPDDTLQARMEERDVVLENAFFTVTVCRRTGWVRCLFDKRLQKEWIGHDPGREAGSASYGFGQYEYNVYSNEEITRYIKKYAYRFYDWGVHDFGKTDYPEAQKRLSYSTMLKDLRLIRAHDSVKVVCTAGAAPESVAAYGNAQDIVWSITLTRDAHIDMEWQLHGKEETPLAESGHIVFPLKLDNPTYRINKMGSVIDPCADLVPYSGTLLHCCEYFVDVSDGNAGMAVVPLDSPLLFIGRNGMWDYEPDYKPEKPELNFNLFNNWWGTNFPQWVGGDLKYRFRLIPHRGDWREGFVWRAAQEAMAGNVVIAEAGIEKGPAARLAGESSARPENVKEILSPGGTLLTDETAAAGTTDAEANAGVFELLSAETPVESVSCGSFSPFTLEVLPGGLTGMAVTCFKPAEDGDGFIVRIRDWQGETRSVTIGFADFVREVVKTDLLEYGEETLPFIKAVGSNKREISLNTGSFEVHTLRIRM